MTYHLFFFFHHKLFAQLNADVQLMSYWIQVASALSDPYLSFAAALNGLAGPLHGLANQVWIFCCDIICYSREKTVISFPFPTLLLIFVLVFIV